MLHRRLRPAALSVLLLLVSSPALAGTTRVGVVVSTAVNLDDAAVDALASSLGAALAAELGVDVIAGVESRRRLPPSGLPEGCVADIECRRDVGARLDADELLMLVIVQLGDRVQIDPTWSHLASGRVASRPAVTIAEGDDSRTAFTAAAPSLLPHIRGQPQPQAPAVVVVRGGPGDDSGRRMTPLTWAAVGVAGAAAVGGAVFAVSARSKYDTLEDSGCRDNPCPASDIRALRRHSLAADVLFGASLAAGVTAAILYLRSGSDEEAPLATVGGGPGDIGLSIGGRF